MGRRGETNSSSPDRAVGGARYISPQRDTDSIWVLRPQLIIAALAVLALLLALPALALAQGEEPPPGGPTDDEVNAIAEQLYCPVCENVPLDVCGTQACADWRDEIRDAIHALEIRVVKLEQLVKFGGMLFALLQICVTLYLGLR